MTEPTSKPTTLPTATPDANGTLVPEPGDRPPAGRLARPPSERYVRPESGGGAAQATAGSLGHRRAAATSIGRALAPALAAGLATAALLVLIGGVLAARQGLLAIAGLGGAVVGLLAAGAAVSTDGVTAPALTRSGTVKAAMTLAVLAVLGGAFGTWAYGRIEGGVMDPLSYLWETFGLFVPVEAAIAGIGAAWGAGAGPIRGRS